MTCIVGIGDRDKVFIGADSAAANHSFITKIAGSKVFINGPFIVGYTTSFRFGNLLEHAWSPPPHPKGDSDTRYLCTTVVDSMRSCLKDGGLAEKTNDVESAGTCLIGYRGRLYMLQDSYAVLRQEPYGAVGSGAVYALGAMHAVRGSVENRLRAGLKAAANFSPTVCGPFRIKCGGFR